MRNYAGNDAPCAHGGDRVSRNRPVRGIVGDARGRKRGRQVTIVFRESWDDACRELGADVPWTARRANLLVEGVPVPRPPQRVRIGDAVLEVTQETDPCSLMDRQHQGLRAALKPE